MRLKCIATIVLYIVADSFLEYIGLDGLSRSVSLMCVQLVEHPLGHLLPCKTWWELKHHGTEAKAIFQNNFCHWTTLVPRHLVVQYPKPLSLQPVLFHIAPRTFVAMNNTAAGERNFGTEPGPVHDKRSHCWSKALKSEAMMDILWSEHNQVVSMFRADI